MIQWLNRAAPPGMTAVGTGTAVIFPYRMPSAQTQATNLPSSNLPDLSLLTAIIMYAFYD
jgi:hypothetical protein